MPSVLFVCTGNMYRSPIAAAAFLERLKRDGKEHEWLVSSAGTWTNPNVPAPANAIQIARNLGLNIENHKTSIISELDFTTYNLILVMEQGHKEAILTEFSTSHGKVHLLTEVADRVPYDIPDPAGKNSREIEQVARQLYDLIENGFTAICQIADTSLKDNSDFNI